MKKVLVISNVNELSASIRYRVYNPLEQLAEDNEVELEKLSFYSLRTSHLLSRKGVIKIFSVAFDLFVFIFRFFVITRKEFDVVVVKNYCFPFLGVRVESCLFRLLSCSTLVYDIDDAIYLNAPTQRNRVVRMFRNPKDKVSFWISQVEHAFISNHYILSDLKSFCDFSNTTHTLRLSLTRKNLYFDTVQDLEMAKMSKRIEVVWLGSSHTEKNLLLWEKFIKRLAKSENVRVTLVGVSEDFKVFQKFSNIELLQWSESNETIAMKRAHFGLNPLIDNLFEERKSAFKVLQYFRAGIIPIVSDVGINSSLVQDVDGIVFNNNKSSTLIETLAIDIKRNVSVYLGSEAYTSDKTVSDYRAIVSQS